MAIVEENQRETRRRLRIEDSAGELPRGCRIEPTTLGTVSVRFVDLSEAEAAKVVRAAAFVLER
jgi:hypothetical protein